MFITKKKHREILRQKVESEISRARADYQALVESITQQLREARDLKAVLEKLAGIGVSTSSVLAANCGGYEIVMPDDVARYVPDHFGGRVIKQEATKVIEISPDGSVKTGLTKRPPDPGFNYILNRKATNQ